MIKRLFDIVFSLILLCVLSLIIAVVWILVRIKLGSPAIFTQSRPGLNEKIFSIYKFRTMTNEKNENGELLPDEIRLTKFGLFLRKLSLDELPQLWNVLKGEMSFVGPRPLLIQYLPLYNEQQKKRHLVRPGITGLAQVNGRNAICWEEKFEYDVYYVENQSLMLDLKIIVLTIKKVFIKEGISKEGHATMPFFEGTKEKQDS